MELFFIVITALYFTIHLLLFTGLRKSLNLNRAQSSDPPRVSVIVSARNEEKNITRCIESLKKLKYPKELFEIILVNDKSTDNTLDLMIEGTKNYDCFKVINSRQTVSGNLKGKANAIDTAIEQSRGDIIVMTDADCIVPIEWIEEVIKYYDESTGMVCGFTKIKFEESLFSRLQCIDWIYLLTLASASSGLNMTMSCVGNNLSFKKKIYYEVGGYESINFSITEDMALMRKISAMKNYNIKFPVDKKCLVESLPCPDLAQVFSQKRRWFRGGIGINTLGYLVAFELFTINLLLVFGLIFLNFKIFILLIFIKIVSELILLQSTFKRFNLTNLFKNYPLFIFFFAFYGLLTPFTFLFTKNIKWKGRKF